MIKSQEPFRSEREAGQRFPGSRHGPWQEPRPWENLSEQYLIRSVSIHNAQQRHRRHPELALSLYPIQFSTRIACKMSSSFTPVPIAAIILAYQSARTLNSCAIAASVMFSYDYILSLGREYQYVWKSGKSRASRLPYLYIRYSYLVFGIVGYVTVPPVSDKSCTVLTWLDVCIQFLNLIGPPVLTTLRAYVLSGQNKVVGGITLTLGLVPFFVNVTSAYLTPPINLPPPDNCFGLWMGSGALKLGLTIGSRSCAVLLDVIAIVVTWRATRSSHRLLKDSFQRSSLQHVMWKNGNIYFFTLLSINTLDLILQALSVRPGVRAILHHNLSCVPRPNRSHSQSAKETMSPSSSSPSPRS
ncbi:hypothetical protein BC628DRAFT_1397148 [Trametes gibbosa]|nr:hypothetical protein BC628DRAFT_1397148 [Trametes gibbosa]